MANTRSNTYEIDDLYSIYAGVVEDNGDPERIGRLKIRVPHVYGPSGPDTSISTADLPWALPIGQPAGLGTESGGISWLPEVGDQVFVQFLDAEPEKPVWNWGNQTRNGANNLKLHKYSDSNKPTRGALTRYGHTLEFNSSSIIATTKSGYALLLDEGSGEQTGNVNLTTPLGQSLKLDDEQRQLLILAPELNANIDNTVTVIAADIDLEAAKTDVVLRSAQEINLKFGTTLNFGIGSEPFVLGTQLSEFLSTLLLYLTTHTHSNGNEGSPTGPPIVPPQATVTPQVSQLISETIFGE
jgi:hypothetical protein